MPQRMRSSLPWGQLPEHLDPEDQKEEGSKPDSKKSSGAKWVQLTQGQRGALLNNEGGLLPDPLLTPAREAPAREAVGPRVWEAR